jgi:hypothetical protein
MDEGKKKAEQPSDQRDVPQTTGQGDFSDIGQKGGDITRSGDRSSSGGQSDVNNLSGKDSDIAQGKDRKQNQQS